MRICRSKLLAIISVVAVATILEGCSSMSVNECLATDWRTVGYEDGVVGYSGNRIGKYRKSCGEHGISPDLNAYQLGRDQGLLEYCKPLNGFRTGARGNSYNGVCPAELDREFMDAYQSGRQLYTLRSRVGSTSNAINSMHSELVQIDKNIVSVGVKILDPSITHEHRAELLVDSKQMAERRGEIKARLPQLEGELLAQQRELDDYRATLPYVE
jgi:hypothetical protein